MYVLTGFLFIRFMSVGQSTNGTDIGQLAEAQHTAMGD